MPALIVEAIAYIGAEWLAGTAIGASMMMAAETWASATILLGGLAYSSYKAKQADAAARDAWNAAQVDRLQTIQSTTAPRELVLGRVRKAGTVFFKASTGTNNQDLYLCIALAGHEIDAVEKIYLNDVQVTLDGSGNVNGAVDATGASISCPYTSSPSQLVTGTVNTGSGYTATIPAGAVNVTGSQVTGTGQDIQYAVATVTVVGTTATSNVTDTTITYQYTPTSASSVKINVHLGASGQTVDSDLHTAFPTDWPTTNVCQGIAYLVVRMLYSETAFPNGVPAVTAVIRGAKCYDPRTSSTAWTENPALMKRYVYTHPSFGQASSVTAAEDARITAAANVCDTSTAYTVAGVAQASRALFKASLDVPFGTAAQSVFDDLSQAMGGSWAFAGGELYMKAGVYTASVMSFTDADLAVIKRTGASEQQSPIGISVHKERQAKFNTVTATIWDEAQQWQQANLTPLVGSALVTRDGANIINAVTFAAISYAPQALHVAGIMMRDARDPLTVTLPFKLRAYPVELFDTVDLTLSRYGWSGKTFTVLGRTWSSDGSIQLTLKETSAAITTMDADFLAQGWAANTNLPTPWQVAAVTGLTLAAGTAELMYQGDGTIVSRMRVTWTQVADQAVVQNGNVEIQYRAADSSGPWASIIVPGAETQSMTSEVMEGVIYVVRARAKTSLAIGDWCGQLTCLILGKSDPPPNYDNFDITFGPTGRRFVTFSYTSAEPLDLAGAHLRWTPGYVTTPAWSSMTATHDGILTASFDTDNGAAGMYTFAICAVDTSGNESATPLYLQRTLPAIGNTITTTGTLAARPTSNHVGDVYFASDTGLIYVCTAAPNTWGVTSVPIAASGTLAARPTTNVIGTTYYATDTLTLYICTGAPNTWISSSTKNTASSGTYASRPTVNAVGDLYYGTDTLLLYICIGAPNTWSAGANNFTNTNQLTDGANLGGTAAWSGVSSVPAPLTDGRVGTALNSSGTVVSNVVADTNITLSTNHATAHFNNAGATIFGLVGYAGAGSGLGVGAGVVGIAPTGASGGTTGVMGNASDAASTGVWAYNSNASGWALRADGKMQCTNSTLVSNLNADLLDGNHASAFAASGHTHLSIVGASSNVYKFNNANVVSGANAANFSGLLPTGSGASTNQWLEVIIDSTSFWIPFWAK